MVVLEIILLIITLIGVKVSSFHEDYLDKDRTNGIKGIFAILILLSHIRSYVEWSPYWYNNLYGQSLEYIGQLMVAPFFFYSGYGILESYKRKSYYHKFFFKNRFLKILLHFDLAVLLFLVIQTPVGIIYPLRNYLTCWIAWDSVGNSNWFVFDILVLYLVAHVGMLFGEASSRDKKSILLLLITAFGTIVLYSILYFVRVGQQWWVDTLFTFPLGMLYSLCKPEIDQRLKNKSIYWITVTVCFIVFAIWHSVFGVDIYGICSVLFILLLVLLTIKIQLNNKILDWLGRNAFAIYILQRLPMNVLSVYGINKKIAIFCIVSIPMVLLISWIFTRILKKLDFCLFPVS